MVLPLLALTWMSAVLAMTDRRSILFQVLFAVFNSVQGFVIITVHGFLRREVGRGHWGGVDGMGRAGTPPAYGVRRAGGDPRARGRDRLCPPPQVQDVVKCQVGGCRGEENENSPDSCKNGQVQILVSAAAPARSGAGPPARPAAPGAAQDAFTSPPLSLSLSFFPLLLSLSVSLFPPLSVFL